MTKFWMICWSYKYNWCLCRFIGKLYILLLTFLMNLSEICITLHGLSWSRIKWLWNPAMYHSVRLTTFLWFLYQLFSKIDETGVSCCSVMKQVSVVVPRCNRCQLLFPCKNGFNIGSAWSFGVFIPRHNDQWPPTLKDFYTRTYPLHFLTFLILEKEPVFPVFNVKCQTREQLLPYL